jgi:hypothetical protein
MKSVEEVHKAYGDIIKTKNEWRKPEYMDKLTFNQVRLIKTQQV